MTDKIKKAAKADKANEAHKADKAAKTLKANEANEAVKAPKPTKPTKPTKTTKTEKANEAVETASRKRKALTQRLMLLETTLLNERHGRFEVMGARGNQYTVEITTYPFCSCPDSRIRHKRCKHIYFILQRVLKCDETEADFYTRAQLTAMMQACGKASVKAGDKAGGEEQSGLDEGNGGTKNENAAGLCGICHESVDSDAGVRCEGQQCTTEFHQTCHDRWVKYKTGAKRVKRGRAESRSSCPFCAE